MDKMTGVRGRPLRWGGWSLSLQGEAVGLGLVQSGEGMASGAPNSNPSTDGRDGGDAAGLFTEVHGRRAETQEAQAGDKEKTSP